MEENKLQLAPLQVTKPLVEALFAKEITRLQYNRILQAASDLSFTKDNVSADYPALKELSRLIKSLDDSRKGIKRPYDDVVDIVQEVFKELIQPLKAIEELKKKELATANEAARQEKFLIEQDQQRRQNIVFTMAQFLKNTTAAVADAKTDTEITRLQKLIGTEKSKKSFYDSFYEEFIEKCKALDEHIKDRKDIIRKNEALNAEIEKAIADGDQEKAVELREHQENLEAATEENILRLQEEAFQQAAAIETVVLETLIDTVKPKSRRWVAEVYDIKLLQKKMPHLVKLVPDDEAIDLLLKSKRAEGALENDKVLDLFGLKFYQKNFY